MTDQENEQIVSVYINFQQIGKKPETGSRTKHKNLKDEIKKFQVFCGFLLQGTGGNLKQRSRGYPRE